MVRKISFLILAIMVLAAGIYASGKLRYWEKSAVIFKIGEDSPFDGRMRGGAADFRAGERFEGRRDFEPHGMRGRNVPDNLRQEFIRPESDHFGRNVPDSLRQRLSSGAGNRSGSGRIEAGMIPGERRERGDIRGGSKINLRNVLLFMAVFASFTVAAIYIDMAYVLIKSSKRSH